MTMQLIALPAPTFTRPADTTAYAQFDLMANSTTAGSVTNRIFTAKRFKGALKIKRAKLAKSSNVITNANFLLHLFATAPTYATSGDNGLLTANTTASNYLGTLNVATMTGLVSDAGAVGQGVPVVGTEVLWHPDWPTSGQADLYGVMAANAAYTPTSAETFTWIIEGEAEFAN
jgi:hypothetical protein